MARPDPVISCMKEIGFLPLRLPRSDVHPLQLLTQNGKDLNLLGDLSHAMITKGYVMPGVVGDVDIAGRLKGRQSARVTLSVGLSLLGNILRGLTGKQLDVSAGYRGAKTLSFEFADVTAEKVDIVQLDQFLNCSDIHPASRHIADLLIDDKVGVITAAIRCKKFVIESQGENGKSFTIDVDAIKDVTKQDVSIESSSGSDTRLAYEGKSPVTFGIQVVRLFFDKDGNYTAFNQVTPGDSVLHMGGRTGANVPSYFEIEGPFARIVE